MAISIVRGSGRISNITDPRVAAPTIGVTTADFATSTDMSADGEVRFNGAAGDPVAGWEVAWIQAQWVETNWVYYRGQQDSHGSIFLQRARPPARPRQACRDTSGPVGDIWAGLWEVSTIPAGSAFPVRVTTSTSDGPGDNANLVERNSLTGQDNFLREVQLEFLFATILAVRDPARSFHQQAHFYWNVRWQARFQPTRFPPGGAGDWTITVNRDGTGGNAGRAFSGAATDHRFAAVLTSAQAHSCNDLANAETLAVATVGNACRREFRRWESVDVRR